MVPSASSKSRWAPEVFTWLRVGAGRGFDATEREVNRLALAVIPGVADLQDDVAAKFDLADVPRRPQRGGASFDLVAQLPHPITSARVGDEVVRLALSCAVKKREDSEIRVMGDALDLRGLGSEPQFTERGLDCGGGFVRLGHLGNSLLAVESLTLPGNATTRYPNGITGC